MSAVLVIAEIGINHNGNVEKRQPLYLDRGQRIRHIAMKLYLRLQQLPLRGHYWLSGSSSLDLAGGQ